MRNIFIIFGTLLMVSCDQMEPADNLPDEVDELKRPVIVLACNEKGVILQGADGQTVCFSEHYHITPIMVKEGYKKGELFIPQQIKE